MPFNLSDEEKKKIEAVSKAIFNNKPNKKLIQSNLFIAFLVSEVYLPYCNTETGDYLGFLFEGDVLDQPYLTCRYLDLIKLNYKLYASDQRKKESEKAQAKAKVRRGRGL